MLSQEEQEELEDELCDVLESVDRFCLLCAEATPRNCVDDECELFPHRYGTEEYEELSDEEWGRLKEKEARQIQEEEACENQQAY